jgi:hypothetical protein
LLAIFQSLVGGGARVGYPIEDGSSWVPGWWMSGRDGQ